jgi:oligoribonuclease (3'-5' exoribonuclease)
MNKIARELEALKEKIEESKKKESNLQGRMEESENRLKETYGMSLQFAKEWIKSNEKVLIDKEKNIREKFAALQEKYPW